MGKYTHLNEDEIISHIEKFGTDDERDIIKKITVPDDLPCQFCEESKIDVEDLEEKIKEAIEVLS